MHWLCVLQENPAPKVPKIPDWAGIYNETRIPSSATLVLCPNQLLEQWKNEWIRLAPADSFRILPEAVAKNSKRKIGALNSKSTHSAKKKSNQKEPLQTLIVIRTKRDLVRCGIVCARTINGVPRMRLHWAISERRHSYWCLIVYSLHTLIWSAILVQPMLKNHARIIPMGSNYLVM